MACIPVAFKLAPASAPGGGAATLVPAVCAVRWPAAGGAGLGRPGWASPGGSTAPAGNWRAWLQWPTSQAPPSAPQAAAPGAGLDAGLRHRRSPGWPMCVGAGTHMPGLSQRPSSSLTMALAGLRAGLLPVRTAGDGPAAAAQSTTPAASAVTVLDDRTLTGAADRAAGPDAGQPGGGFDHHLMAHRLTLALRDRERLADWTRVANDWYWEADADLAHSPVSPSLCPKRAAVTFEGLHASSASWPGGSHFIEGQSTGRRMREDLLGRRAFATVCTGVRLARRRVDWVRAAAENRLRRQAGHSARLAAGVSQRCDESRASRPSAPGPHRCNAGAGVRVSPGAISRGAPD